MKKLLWFVTVCGGVYLAFAIAAMIVVPHEMAKLKVLAKQAERERETRVRQMDRERHNKIAGYEARIAEQEARKPALNSAIKTLSTDYATLTTVINKYSSSKMAKEESLDMLLANPDVNRLAMNYLGKDFAVERREFLGRVKHQRDSLKRQKEITAKPSAAEEEVHRKVLELERKKKSLSVRMTASESERQDWMVQMRDIDDQLNALRVVDEQRQFRMASRKENTEHADVLNENTVFQIAEQYERATITTLSQTIAARLAALRAENEKIDVRLDELRRGKVSIGERISDVLDGKTSVFTLQGFAAVLNTWPLNVFVKKAQAPEVQPAK